MRGNPKTGALIGVDVLVNDVLSLHFSDVKASEDRNFETPTPSGRANVQMVTPRGVPSNDKKDLIPNDPAR